MTNVTYQERVSHYESKKGMRLLERLAERRGVSITALLRMLTREEAERVGLEAEGGD